MAGDFEYEPSLQTACINVIADNIDVYIQKYPPKNAPAQSLCLDSGVSGSTMMETSSATEEHMECDCPCPAPKMSEHYKLSKNSPNLKIIDNIASLQTQCHHNPPCGSKKHPFCDENNSIFIPRPLSEELLKSVCKKGRLDNQAAAFFSDNTKLNIQRMYLRKAGHLNLTGLEELMKHHVLVELNAADINEVRMVSPLVINETKKRITVADIVRFMNNATKEKLMALNVSGVPSEREDHVPLAIYVTAGQFKKLSVLTNIRFLNVSYTNFTDGDLNAVIACMKHLQSLNISKTFVRSILYLGDMHAPKLKSLCMSNLDKLNMPKESLFDVFCKMSELQHLDISTEIRPPANHSRSSVAHNSSINVAISMVMVGGFPLPKLVSLDISGREGIEEVEFLNFYSNHRDLVFLGLLHTGLDGLPCFADEKNKNFNSEIRVTGDRTEAQIMEALIKYYRRPFFAKEALFSLFNHTQLVPQYNKEQLELVLRCMRNHRTDSEISYSVQLAATACVYNLTNRETGSRISAPVLSKVVVETLATMEKFPDRSQLQKNCLMTLCSDRILKEVTFDYFKTAKLVMQCLRSNQDSAMHRMSVAIISILAAKISTKETAVLGCHAYMKVLLEIVEKKLEANAIDLTLKFTLSALWNLTDESPTTCQNFIENNGLKLFVRILSANDDNPCLQTKVLGLLNNLAEVPDLRHFLLQHDLLLIKSIQKLLHSKHIEVSYFAAGIISHLAILDIEKWEVLTHVPEYRNDLLTDLYNCVLSWDPPPSEMVAYRTFKPFFPLLRQHDTPAMQLWAAWAIRHVCLKNGEKYQEMLVSEQGIDCLLEVKGYANLDLKVRELIELTLDFIQDNHPELKIF